MSTAWSTFKRSVKVGLVGGLIAGGTAVVMSPAELRVVDFNMVSGGLSSAVAEQDAQVAELSLGLRCYKDPTGETPTSAIVKTDGEVYVYPMDADMAWTAAENDTVWILRWCDAP